ncbi:hypothetical protein GU700_00560 [Methylobacterium sp. NI91]|nr:MULTISPECIES: intracellular growth attenuator family protein [unclassified Methylobacterium]QIJ73233.1 hypothetical protein CLZ_00560 [Methylobacterium sp. CLZ]QIJ78138.1 hypothetical protein GU700_00560 [Methylobacterium sp. NI91]
MTSDTQLDRSASPLASVSNQIHPTEPDRKNDQLAEVADASLNDGIEPAESLTNPFEGFGSFA